MGYKQDGSFATMFKAEPIDIVSRKMVEHGGDVLHDEVIERTPVRDDPFYDPEHNPRPPGTLKKSWQKGPVRASRHGFEREVFTEDPIAPHVEWDTRPHIIRPTAAAEARARARSDGTRGAFLVWRDPDTGHLIFAKEVHHPGTTGQHMMRDSVVVLEGRFEREMRPFVAEWKKLTEAA